MGEPEFGIAGGRIIVPGAGPSLAAGLRVAAGLQMEVYRVGPGHLCTANFHRICPEGNIAGYESRLLHTQCFFHSYGLYLQKTYCADERAVIFPTSPTLPATGVVERFFGRKKKTETIICFGPK